MGAFKLVPVNDVAASVLPADGILLWETANFALGRVAGPREGFAFPMNMSQLSSRHCTLQPSREVRAGRRHAELRSLRAASVARERQCGWPPLHEASTQQAERSCSCKDRTFVVALWWLDEAASCA